MSQAENVCNGLDPSTGEPIDPITATDLRRHFGNRLVVPPVKHRGNGVFEAAELDGHGSYYYPSEVLVKVPHGFTVDEWPTKKQELIQELRDAVEEADCERFDAALEASGYYELVAQSWTGETHEPFPVDPNAPHTDNLR